MGASPGQLAWHREPGKGVDEATREFAGRARTPWEPTPAALIIPERSTPMVPTAR